MAADGPCPQVARRHRLVIAHGAQREAIGVVGERDRAARLAAPEVRLQPGGLDGIEREVDARRREAARAVVRGGRLADPPAKAVHAAHR